ncbi:MAG TPA: hypothetical protein VF542_01095, partial [Jatrophihabitans sp.]
ALALAPLGLVLLVAGILAASLDGVGWTLAGLLVAGLAVVLLGVAWGLRRSAALSEVAAGEQRLDEVLVAAVQASGATCGEAGVGGAAGVGGVGAHGSDTSTHGSDSSTCGATGLVCGSSGAPGGCGASCLTRANSAERSVDPGAERSVDSGAERSVDPGAERSTAPHRG